MSIPNTKYLIEKKEFKMLLLFVLFVWIPLLIFFGKKFGYQKVWGCTATILLIAFLAVSLKSCA